MSILDVLAINAVSGLLSAGLLDEHDWIVNADTEVDVEGNVNIELALQFSTELGHLLCTAEPGMWVAQFREHSVLNDLSGDDTAETNVDSALFFVFAEQELHNQLLKGVLELRSVGQHSLDALHFSQNYTSQQAVHNLCRTLTRWWRR